MMTDPIADMLTRLRNANTAFHDEVLMPSSKLKEALARILEREGYIAGWDVAKDETASRQPAEDRAEVHARPQAHDLRTEARLEARPPGLLGFARRARGCSAAWASPSSRPTRDS